MNTAVGQHPSPKVFEAAKDAAPPDRGGVQLDFGSEGTENTNDARGDHGCGLSGAQATAQKAIFNQADVDSAEHKQLRGVTEKWFGRGG